MLGHPCGSDGKVRTDITIACVNSHGDLLPLEATLHYDSTDPYAVSAHFVTSGGEVVWTFARNLLRSGLTDPAGEGDVHVWPCLDPEGRAVVIIELSSPDGELVAQARAQDIYRFVTQTLALVPAGLESSYLDVDALIDQLLRSEIA